MNPGADDAERQARAQMREAVLASVALVSRSRDNLEVPASVLLEGTDAALTAQVLAAICSALLETVLTDGGRQLLVKVGRDAVCGWGADS